MLRHAGVVIANVRHLTDFGKSETTATVMTTEKTAKAATDATPGKGEVLVYIDWQGKKLHEKPDAKRMDKTEVKPE